MEVHDLRSLMVNFWLDKFVICWANICFESIFPPLHLYENKQAKSYQNNISSHGVAPPVGAPTPPKMPPNAMIAQWYNFIDEENHYIWTAEYEEHVAGGRPEKRILKTCTIVRNAKFGKARVIRSII